MLKKSQAALEFLTTYAWAFLIILVMVGALAYFGILSPSKLLPERCNFGSEFECRDYKLDKTSATATVAGIKLKLVNNLDEPISVSRIESSSEGTTSLICLMTTATTIAPAGSADFNLVDCALLEWTNAGFTAGQKGKVAVTITYNTVKAGANFPHKVDGEIYATVQ